MQGPEGGGRGGGRGRGRGTHSLDDIDVTPGLGGSNDDRAGNLKHPTRGTLLTYVFEVSLK